MVATIGVVIWKLFGGMLSETSSVGGQGPRPPEPSVPDQSGPIVSMCQDLESEARSGRRKQKDTQNWQKHAHT